MIFDSVISFAKAKQKIFVEEINPRKNWYAEEGWRNFLGTNLVRTSFYVGRWRWNQICLQQHLGVTSYTFRFLLPDFLVGLLQLEACDYYRKCLYWHQARIRKQNPICKPFWCFDKTCIVFSKGLDIRQKWDVFFLSVRRFDVSIKHTLFVLFSMAVYQPFWTSCLRMLLTCGHRLW